MKMSISKWFVIVGVSALPTLAQATYIITGSQFYNSYAGNISNGSIDFTLSVPDAVMSATSPVDARSYLTALNASFQDEFGATHSFDLTTPTVSVYGFALLPSPGYPISEWTGWATSLEFASFAVRYTNDSLNWFDNNTGALGGCEAGFCGWNAGDPTLSIYQVPGLLAAPSLSVPAPPSLALLSIGLAGLGYSRRKAKHVSD